MKNGRKGTEGERGGRRGKRSREKGEGGKNLMLASSGRGCVIYLNVHIERQVWYMGISIEKKCVQRYAPSFEKRLRESER